jgi:hypothetical protein
MKLLRLSPGGNRFAKWLTDNTGQSLLSRRKYKNVSPDVINVSVVTGNTWKYDGIEVQLNLNNSYYSWNFGTRKYKLVFRPSFVQKFCKTLNIIHISLSPDHYILITRTEE